MPKQLNILDLDLSLGYSSYPYWFLGCHVRVDDSSLDLKTRLSR